MFGQRGRFPQEYAVPGLGPVGRTRRIARFHETEIRRRAAGKTVRSTEYSVRSNGYREAQIDREPKAGLPDWKLNTEYSVLWAVADSSNRQLTDPSAPLPRGLHGAPIAHSVIDCNCGRSSVASAASSETELITRRRR